MVKGIDSPLEPFGILLPQQIVQKDPHGVHAQTLSPAQFLINFLRIESSRLPHFQFVDRGGGNEIAAHQPGLLLVPVVRFLLGPVLCDREYMGGECKNQNRDNGA